MCKRIISLDSQWRLTHMVQYVQWAFSALQPAWYLIWNAITSSSLIGHYWTCSYFPRSLLSNMLVCINFEKMLLIFDKILIIFSHWLDTAQKMKFSIKDFFSKCNQIRRKLRTWSHFLKKSLMENFIFCAVWFVIFSGFLKFIS